MKIGIDAHSIGSGKGGNDTYYTELVRWLTHVDHDNDYFVLGCRTQRVIEEAGKNRNFRFLPVSANRFARICVSLPCAAWGGEFDIFHAQGYRPPFLRCKVITSILDIAFEHFPEFFPPAQRSWMKVLIAHAAHRSDHILTISEHAKNDLTTTYGIDPAKISVTPLSAAEQFHPRDHGASQALVAGKYGVEGSFLLYVGRLQVRKNLVRLIEAYHRVRQSGALHKLVLVGQPDSTSGPLFARVRELRLENDVRFLGHVDWSDLPFLYSAAETFVFPSFFEGFGLPVIEAMACGTPVITSYGSSLEEIGKGAALLIDPLDVTSLTQAIEKVLCDKEERERLRQAGLRRSSEFSFEQTALRTVEAYRRTAVM